MPSEHRAKHRCVVARTLASAALLGLVAGAPRATAGPPAAPELLCARGVLAYRAGELDRAAHLLRQAIDRRPEMIDARHYLGLALLRQGKRASGRRALAAAVRIAGDEPSVRLLLDLGLAYLSEQNFSWAVRVLRRAAEMAPRDGRVRYNLGVAMLRADNPVGAAEHLEAARSLQGVDALDVRLQLAMAHYIDQRWQRSREQLDGLLLGRVGAVARRLMRASYEGDGIDAALVSAELSTGAVIDTNPLFEHETTAPTAAGLLLGGNLSLRPWVDARNLIAGQLAVERVFYFPTASEDRAAVDDASRTDLRASVRLARRLWRGTHAVSAAYHFGLTFLDAAASSGAGEPTLVDENHIFAEVHGGEVTYRLGQGSSQQLQARYRIARQDFADLPRSHLANELSVQWLASLLDGQVRLIGGAAARHELADSNDYDAVAPSGVLGASTLVPLDIVVGLRAGYEYKSHYRSADSERWGGTRRVDHRLEITAEIARAFSRGFRVGAIYRRLQNFSSVQSFDYGRNYLSVALSWSYAP